MVDRRTFAKMAGLSALAWDAVSSAGTAAPKKAAAGAAAAAPAQHGRHIDRADRKAWAREHFKGFENILIPSFSPDLKQLDEAGIRLDVRKSIEHGFFSTLVPDIDLSPAEYRRFLEIAIDEAQGRISVALGGKAGQVGPSDKALLRDAEALGCSHMILNLPPEGSAQDLVRYATEVSNSTNMGIYLWMAQIHNFKRFHRSRIPFEVFDQLADLPNMIAIKVGDPDPATIFHLFERYNDRLLVGALMLNIMPFAVKAFGQQWSGAFTVEALQTPSKRYATEYFALLRAGKDEEAMRLYWQYLDPAFGAMTRILAPLMPRGGHPWGYLKIYQFLGGGNGGRIRNDPHQADLPQISAQDLESARALFKSLDMDPVDLPFEAMQVGRVNYDRGIRLKDLT